MMNDSYLTQVWSFPLTFFEVIDCEDQWRGENPQQTETGKGVLKICSKFTGEHPCESAISIMFLCSLTEIALQHGCSPVNLLHIFRTPFSKSTSGWLLHSKQLPVLILKSPQVSRSYESTFFPPCKKTCSRTKIRSIYKIDKNQIKPKQKK